MLQPVEGHEGLEISPSASSESGNYSNRRLLTYVIVTGEGGASIAAQISRLGAYSASPDCTNCISRVRPLALGDWVLFRAAVAVNSAFD